MYKAYETLTVTNGGVDTLPLGDAQSDYLVTGTLTVTAPYIITSSGTAYKGREFTFRYEAEATITTGSITIFGYAMPAIYSDKNSTIIATYNGTGWNVRIDVDFEENGTINSDKLATDAVIEAKIANLAVTTGKINDLAITSGKIGANAVIAGKYGALSIVAADIANTTITAGKIANATITVTQMANNSVDSAQIVAGSIDSAHLSASVLNSASLITDSIITEPKLTQNTPSGSIISGPVCVRQVNSTTLKAALTAAANVTLCPVYTDEVILGVELICVTASAIVSTIDFGLDSAARGGAGNLQTALATEMPGNNTGKFLAEHGSPLRTYHEFFGIEDVIATSAGTWTTTRVAAGQYCLRHTPADNTTILGIDITEAIIKASNKGLRLDSFSVVYKNSVADLDAHSIVLYKTVYNNSAAPTITSPVMTGGTLAVGQDTDPVTETVTIDTAIFNSDGNSAYILELTINAALTSEYDFYGIGLNFSFIEDDLYIGQDLDNTGSYTVLGDGNITVTSSADLSASAFAGQLLIYYIPK